MQARQFVMQYSESMAPEGRFESMGSAPEPRTAERNRPRCLTGGRAAALLEVLICSDFPTQIALAATVRGARIWSARRAGAERPRMSLCCRWSTRCSCSGSSRCFCPPHGERAARCVSRRRGRPWREARAGLPLTFVALVLGVAVLARIQQFAPWLHTVEHNPLQDLIRTPRDAAVFAVVVVVAGGVREEIQRAFLLRRFEQWLGGAGVGVVVTSVAFGAGHLMQGADAAIATGAARRVLGRSIYLRRRSIVAPVVSHSGFNLLQLAQFLVLGR